MLFNDNNLILFFLSLLTGFFYILYVYMKSPYRSISIKNSLYYLGFGTLSITILIYFFKIFPGWNNYIEYGLISTVLFKAFIQVALLEETCKYISFSIVDNFRSKLVEDHPVGIMFYAAMPSMIFAMLENFDYAINSSEEFATRTLAIRAISSTVLHLVAGLLLGYWIALYRVKKHPKFSRNKWDMFITKHTWIRKLSYTFMGIISATIIHGLYDYVLFIEYEYSDITIITILLTGLILAYIGNIDLIKNYKLKKP